ncbi:ICAM5 protein, partial [Picathartes gymnocephalus]|nr:ICAM5 protein [Picathartes gymnocephalus]
LECRADGDPAPSTRCDREGGGARDGGGHHGGAREGGGRVVTRADGGRYVCRATNRHGVAVRSVLVTVE